MLFANLPDLSSPGLPAVSSIVIGFIWTTLAFWRRAPREEVQWAAFLGAYLGAGFGFMIYGIGLIIELY